MPSPGLVATPCYCSNHDDAFIGTNWYDAQQQQEDRQTNAFIEPGCCGAIGLKTKWLASEGQHCREFTMLLRLCYLALVKLLALEDADP